MQVRIDRPVAVEEDGAATRLRYGVRRRSSHSPPGGSRPLSLGPALGSKRGRKPTERVVTPGSRAERVRLVRESLEGAVAGRLASCPGVSVGYSGGLDSSIVAWLTARHAPTDLVVIGVAGSPDLMAAKAGAELLGLPLTVRIVTSRALHDALSRWSAELDGLQGTMRSVMVATALALEVAPQALVTLGQGADELFFGYAHFLGVNDDEALRRSEEDLARLRDRDWPVARQIARSRGQDLYSPFLDDAVIASARAAPVSVHLAGGERKSLLRDVGRSLGLPEALCARAKKAFQYGSGIDRALQHRPFPA